MTIPVVRKKAKRPKTRLGCITCRTRRVKCDEARPCCQKCVSAKRECGGYELGTRTLDRHALRPILPNEGQTNGYSPVSSLPVVSMFRTPEEWQGFELFGIQTGFVLPSFTANPQWETMAMQLAGSEPAIAYAVAALGSLFSARNGQNPTSLLPTFDSARRKTAIQQYAKAISSVRKLVNKVASKESRDGIEAVLIACLVLMCFEVVQGFRKEAAAHLRNGLKILYSRVGIPHALNVGRNTVQMMKSPRSPLEVLTQLFVCLDSDLSMFGASGQHYLHASDSDNGKFAMETLRLTSDPFISLEEAAWSLVVLSKAVAQARGTLFKIAKTELETKYAGLPEKSSTYYLTFVKSRLVNVEAYPELAAEIGKLERSVEAWYSALSGMSRSFNKATNVAYDTLHIQYFGTWFISAYWRDPTEAGSDRHRMIFLRFLNLALKKINDSARVRPPCQGQYEPSASYGSRSQSLKGIIVLLYLTATKCRDSTTRWTSIFALSKLNFQEGAFDSYALGVYALRIVEIEEEMARVMTGTTNKKTLTCEDVPESARFLDVTLGVDHQNDGIGILKCSRLAADALEGIEVEEHKFAIPEVVKRMENFGSTSYFSPA